MTFYIPIKITTKGILEIEAEYIEDAIDIADDADTEVEQAVLAGDVELLDFKVIRKDCVLAGSPDTDDDYDEDDYEDDGDGFEY